jgi:hypothetical protein
MRFSLSCAVILCSYRVQLCVQLLWQPGVTHGATLAASVTSLFCYRKADERISMPVVQNVVQLRSRECATARDAWEGGSMHY